MIDLLNALVVLSNYVLIPALAYGSQLALGALGVTLIYGILRFSNFAHGDTMAFGAMVTILVTWLFQGWGISLGPLPTALLAIPFGIAATAVLLLTTDRLVYRFYRQQKAAPVILVIVSMGVMFVMNGLVRFIIGPNDQRFSDGERFIISAREFKKLTGLSEGLAFKTTQGITIVTAVIVVAILFWFLNRTRTGKSMRAFSDNEDLALLSGINPDRVVMVTWLIVAGLAATAGALYGLDSPSSHLFTYNFFCRSLRRLWWAAWEIHWGLLPGASLLPSQRFLLPTRSKRFSATSCPIVLSPILWSSSCLRITNLR